jgi:hypothetical protein
MRTTFGIALLAVVLLARCGFGLADDSSNPIPGNYWGWVCLDGGAVPDGGCPPPTDGG